MQPATTTTTYLCLFNILACKESLKGFTTPVPKQQETMIVSKLKEMLVVVVVVAAVVGKQRKNTFSAFKLSFGEESSHRAVRAASGCSAGQGSR